VQEINIQDIKEERKERGITELLEGGELNLSEFKNVEVINIVREGRFSEFEEKKRYLESSLTEVKLDEKLKLT